MLGISRLPGGELQGGYPHIRLMRLWKFPKIGRHPNQQKYNDPHYTNLKRVPPILGNPTEP